MGEFKDFLRLWAAIITVIVLAMMVGGATLWVLEYVYQHGPQWLKVVTTLVGCSFLLTFFLWDSNQKG